MKRNHIIATLGFTILTSCAAQQGQNHYNYNEVGQSTLVDFATIIQVKQVAITGRNTGTGAVLGGAAGAGAGSYIGSGSGSIWAAAGGAVAGAVIGSVAEQAAANTKGMEYTVVTEKGKAMTIVQNMNDDDEPLHKGERVIVQTTGTYQRVLPAEQLPTQIKRPKGIKVID